MSRRSIRCLIAVCLVLACASIARPAETRLCPPSIALTKADCDEINGKSTLRGRPVSGRVAWAPSQATWDGERVFTGKKSDIIAWFRGYPQLTAQTVMGGDQYSGHQKMRNYQYDLLCDALLNSGDPEVRKAVVWDYVGFGTGYLRPRWEALRKDPKFGGPGDRLAAALRIVRLAPSKWPKAFWTTYAKDTRPEDLVAVHLELRGWNPNGFTWEVFRPRHVHYAQARALLRPLVRREYLTSRLGERGRSIVELALVLLHQFGPAAAADVETVVREAICHAEKWRAGSDLLLPRLDVSHLAADVARELRALALGSGEPDVAGAAFWQYLKTPAGRHELKKGGAERYLSGVMTAALARPTREQRVKYLRALVATREARACLLRLLRDRKAEIAVAKDQFPVLKSAWRKAPEAIKFILPKEED